MDKTSKALGQSGRQESVALNFLAGSLNTKCRIVTAAEMKQIDRYAIDKLLIPSTILMETAGLEAARLITKRYLESKLDAEIVVLCGKGNNGGDGLVVARKLLANGFKVRVFLLEEIQALQDECALNYRILNQMKAKISILKSAAILEEFFLTMPGRVIVVDAILGIGLERPLDGLLADVVETVNTYADEIVALDVPTGINATSGEVSGTAIRATYTISFGYPKIGHFIYPAAMYCGELYNVDLGYPVSVLESHASASNIFLNTIDTVASLLTVRDRYGHKNSFGHCLLVGGSPGRTGAIAMSSESCLKMGTGLVTVASWGDSFPSLEARLAPEIMSLALEVDSSSIAALKNFSSIVVGPGLGLRENAGPLMHELLVNAMQPIVVDADGINLIADHNLMEDLVRRSAGTVLTPHPGEMARLLKKEKEWVVANPLKAAEEAVELTGAVVVLKGPTTIIRTPNGETYLNYYPNDGMATAGSGDVLAGMIGGLIGQGIPADEAARLGVYLHSTAGDFAAKKLGHRSMTARAIIENISQAFQLLRQYDPARQRQALIKVTSYLNLLSHEFNLG
jgi:hydroxyethylthiazole kinase-like uncharacterized protein yjeF